MTNDIETLLTAPYVKIDDELAGPRWLGRPPVLTDSELVCVALAQSLLGFTSETHWLRYAGKHLTGMFPYLPQQSGYNKRLRSALGLVKRVIRMLAKSSDFWLDDCWIVDSTPVPCGMSRQTVKRSDLAGWAGYGYCASHSRFYWGLKLYLVCTPSGMPILWALADPKIGEREVLASMLEVEADMVTEHDGILLISDKGFAGRAFETLLEEHGVTLLRPSRKDEQARYGEPMLKPRERPPSPREAARWIITAPERVGPLIAQRLHRLLEHCPELRQTHDLVRQFASMLDARNAAPLPDWLDQLATSGLAPLAGIATALREDQQAVTQGITTPYNSGINEGRITDVKLQKRIMAGRAGVPLLRHRVVLIAHLRRRYAAPATAAPR